MRVVVATEQRFYQYADHIYVDGPANYTFWRRYLDVFDEIIVLARVALSPKLKESWHLAHGAGVKFMPIPNYFGPKEYVARMFTVNRKIQQRLELSNSYILRIPGQLSYIAGACLKKTNHPYGLEVVGDPYDVFAPGVIKHPLRPFFRLWFTIKMKAMCRNACAVAYVTEKTLQRRYRIPPGVFATHYSSIDLPDEAFVSQPRSFPQERKKFSVVTIASLSQLYKGVDTLIEAMAICYQRGCQLKLTVIGDGQYRTELEKQAGKLGFSQRIKFLGMIPSGVPIRNQLDQADLFVLPSLTEGLPRVMIEAMARALPCIGSTAGGIPELLVHDDLVPPGDSELLAQAIENVINAPSRMKKMSSRNLRKAREYSADTLQQRRCVFYRHLKNQTKTCLLKRGAL